MRPAVHTHVTTKPVGKKARFVPGRKNGVAAATAAEADAAAAPDGSVVVVDCLAKTPLTKDASCDERVALKS